MGVGVATRVSFQAHALENHHILNPPQAADVGRMDSYHIQKGSYRVTLVMASVDFQDLDFRVRRPADAGFWDISVTGFTGHLWFTGVCLLHVSVRARVNRI